jgi:hypothetical protein
VSDKIRIPKGQLEKIQEHIRLQRQPEGGGAGGPSKLQDAKGTNKKIKKSNKKLKHQDSTKSNGGKSGAKILD